MLIFFFAKKNSGNHTGRHRSGGPAGMPFGVKKKAVQVGRMRATPAC